MIAWFHWHTASGALRLNSQPFVSQADAEASVEQFRSWLKKPVVVRLWMAKPGAPIDELIWERQIGPDDPKS